MERNVVYEPKLFDLVMGCNINTGPVFSSSSSSSSSSVTEVSSSYADACIEESSGCNNYYWDCTNQRPENSNFLLKDKYFVQVYMSRCNLIKKIIKFKTKK